MNHLKFPPLTLWVLAVLAVHTVSRPTRFNTLKPTGLVSTVQPLTDVGGVSFVSAPRVGQLLQGVAVWSAGQVWTEPTAVRCSEQ